MFFDNALFQYDEFENIYRLTKKQCDVNQNFILLFTMITDLFIENALIFQEFKHDMKIKTSISTILMNLSLIVSNNSFSVEY